jgi:hypothetical protein
VVWTEKRYFFFSHSSCRSSFAAVSPALLFLILQGKEKREGKEEDEDDKDDVGVTPTTLVSTVLKESKTEHLASGFRSNASEARLVLSRLARELAAQALSADNFRVCFFLPAFFFFSSLRPVAYFSYSALSVSVG